jgi:hypothetical protein
VVVKDDAKIDNSDDRVKQPPFSWRLNTRKLLVLVLVAAALVIDSCFANGNLKAKSDSACCNNANNTYADSAIIINIRKKLFSVERPFWHH